MNKSQGTLAQFGPRYIDWGIPVVPVLNKKPAIRRWPDTTVYWFRWIREKFPDANIGILTGRRSGLTVVDVDDPHQVDTAISIFGDTCIKVQTPGGMHLYYRSRGESRRIRYEGMPIDILGESSYCVVPPSHTEKGQYRFVEGDLDLIDELPPLKRSTNRRRTAILSRTYDRPTGTTSPARSLSYEAGSRNNDLFLFGCKAAFESDDRDTVETLIRQQNLQIASPLDDVEVTTIIDSIYTYKSNGTLRPPDGEQWISLTKSEVENLTPEALQLLAHLKLCHNTKNGAEFYLANATKNRLGISLSKLRSARKCLSDFGLIDITHPGGKGPNDPPRAVLTTRSSK